MALLNKKVLVVEDDPSMLLVLSKTLAREGFDILKAVNGKEGLDVALKEHPDLIFLDVLMPVMDGMTTMKKLREDAWGKDVPIVLLTNVNPDNEGLADIVKGHPAFYILKSNFSLDSIAQKAREALKIG